LPGSGPCGPARAEVEYRCAEAERLAQAAEIQVQRLREAKHMLARVEAQRDSDARVRDRRLLSDAKENARRAYRESFTRAKSGGASGVVQVAAGEWLREINRLNQQLELADRRAADLARQVAELTAALPGIELAADAARISAEAAQVSCVEARRAYAACEEDAARQVRAPAAQALPASSTSLPAAQPLGMPSAQPLAQPLAQRSPDVDPPPPAATVVEDTGPAPISLLLRGDRQALLGLTLRLADETGVEAGRLQLLLLELRQAIAARALEDGALAFPAGHPFWGQFEVDTAWQLTASLGRLGFAFDGRDGWRDGRAPGTRELAMALADIGLDPRVLRRPAGQAAIDGLWQGTRVLVEEWLATAAPDLSLGRLIDVLGPRAERLGELWDMWGRLRPRLVPA
jgi:hypothetical protein